MTTKQKIALIKRCHRPYSRTRSYEALSAKYDVPRVVVRYYLEKGYKERIIKNAKKWQKDNKEKLNAYRNKRNKKLRSL